MEAKGWHLPSATLLPLNLESRTQGLSFLGTIQEWGGVGSNWSSFQALLTLKHSIYASSIYLFLHLHIKLFCVEGILYNFVELCRNTAY